MKCPKCGYLGFEQVERCRNCGYDFSLAPAASTESAPDLPIRSGNTTVNPLDDLALVDAASANKPARMTDVPPEVDRLFGTRAASPADELPLFESSIDDEPLITKASPPRPPLAVRRSTPEVPRVRSGQPRMQSLDLGLELEPAPRSSSSAVTPGERAALQDWPESREVAAAAGVFARLAAVVIDLAILLAVDLLVVYFTLQICGISLDDAGILPKGPLLAFIFVQNGGYLVAFTAGGQTLGKMVAGIRVVPAEASETLDLGRAFMRTVMWLMLAVPAGLGFLTLLGRDHRGLHDRFAGTRVVRASA